jgi:hypothetical protein
MCLEEGGWKNHTGLFASQHTDTYGSNISPTPSLFNRPSSSLPQPPLTLGIIKDILFSMYSEVGTNNIFIRTLSHPTCFMDKYFLSAFGFQCELFSETSPQSTSHGPTVGSRLSHECFFTLTLNLTAVVTAANPPLPPRAADLQMTYY